MSFEGWVARAPFVAAAFASLCAGCGHSGGVDAGVDAGPDNAIGGYCLFDSDCSSQLCDTQAPNGYCTRECQDNRGCPYTSVCIQLNDGSGLAMCAAQCASDSDCEAGYVCKPFWDVCIPPEGGCADGGECPAGQTCEPNTGFCSGAAQADGPLGGACNQPDDCSGEAPVCLTAGDGFPGGYCTNECPLDGGGCAAGSTCFSSFFLCMKTCATSSDCRTGYVCVPSSGGGMCLPRCHENLDCLELDQICDTTTGVCSTVAVDAGQPVSCPVPDAGVVDAGSFPANDAGYPASFPPPPVVPWQGGPILHSPKFVPIFFSNDDPSQVSQLEAFDSMLGSSAYWKTIGLEYGVGAATATAPVQVTDVATGTLDDSAIGPWLDQNVSSGILPAPDANTLYVLHYPASLTIVLNGSLFSCTFFGGYHAEYQTAKGAILSYAVLPRCTLPPMSTLDTETLAESHELFEGSTDPQPDINPAFVQVQSTDYEWTLITGGGELGDMCESNPAAPYEFAGLPFLVQRMWSNASAAAGHDPCIPLLPAEVYFDAAPVMTDSVQGDFLGMPLTLTGVSLPGCEPRTIPVDFYSDAPSVPWQVSVLDVGSLNDGVTGTISYSLDRSVGQNGDVANLTLQPVTAMPGNLELFVVISTLGEQVNLWVGVAGQ